MTDLIERLRTLLRCRCEPDAACCEACSAVDAVADEIERQRRELADMKSEADSWRANARDSGEEARKYKRELTEYKAAAPLCDEHQPKGGTRARCLVCAVMELSSAISRIDYELGEPNEMEVSGYDVHCNPEPVIVGARNVRRQLTEARGLLQSLLSYTEACEGLLNASPAGQVKAARAFLASDQPAAAVCSVCDGDGTVPTVDEHGGPARDNCPACQPSAVKPCADCGEPTDVWHDGTHLCWKCRA